MTYKSGIAEAVAVGNCIKQNANLPRCWLNVKHHFQRHQQQQQQEQQEQHEEMKQAKIFISDNKIAKVKNFNGKLSTVVVATLANSDLVQCSKSPLTATQSVPTMKSKVTATSTAVAASTANTHTDKDTDTHLQKSNMIFDIISRISCGYSSILHLTWSTLLSSGCTVGSTDNQFLGTDSLKHPLRNDCRIASNEAAIATPLTSSTLALSIRQNKQGCLKLMPNRIALSNIWDVVVLLSMLLLLLLHQTQSVSASSSLMNKHEPMFISRSETFKFVVGDTIVLPCEVANTDPYVVAWKRGIAILTAGSVKVTPDPRVRLVSGFNLQIRDAVPQDAGDYICQIATMEPREITHTVEILVPPRIHHISTGGHLQVKKGSSVRIECSASGNPTPNVTWSRKNNILPNGEEKLHSHILSIENVDRHKGGVYICTANNGVGQPASSQVVLHVLYPPEISVERPVVFSGEGHEAMLVCIVHGETQPEVIWFKDTMQLDTTERHIMENRGSRHTLIIRKVHPQDFGNYSCVAENQLGKSRKTLQLSGKPNVAVFNSPPISQYKDRYNISWTVESHTPIEEYKLSFRRLPQGHEVDNSIDSHTNSMSSSSTLLQMYGSNGGGSGIFGSTHQRGGLGGLGGGSYANVMHWGRNDWRDVVLPAIPLSHHYTQGMSYMIRGLDPDQHYEATVQARNRYGWSELTHAFLFSTSSNDGLVDLSSFLNHGLSDNEMRDLSVTFYGGAGKGNLQGIVALFSCLTLISKNILPYI